MLTGTKRQGLSLTQINQSIVIQCSIIFNALPNCVPATDLSLFWLPSHREQVPMEPGHLRINKELKDT